MFVTNLYFDEEIFDFSFFAADFYLYSPDKYLRNDY
jgi:hypothetical protein